METGLNGSVLKHCWGIYVGRAGGGGGEIESGY